jgi:hypothetical protein
MAKPIETSQATMDYVHRLIDASSHIWRELGLNGGEVTQGAAIFAGMIAKCNAKAGHEEVVGMMSAAIFMRLGGGAAKTKH